MSSERERHAVVEHLPRVVPGDPHREPIHGARHAMREVTRSAAGDGTYWTPSRASEVATFFDEQSLTWGARYVGDPARFAPIDDALARGGPVARGRCADVGCGTGHATAWLARHFASVVGLDLSIGMLRHGEDVVRVLADCAALPLATASLDAVVLMNALLFPAEVARVLKPAGAVVWVSSVGDDTPIYLPPDEVAAALPGEWSGAWSEAGDGTWAVLRRAHA